MATTEQTETEWWRYFQNLLNIQGVSVNRFAEEVDIAPTTPGMWRNKGRHPTPELARKVAGYFNRPVTEVFLKGGILFPEELAAHGGATTPLADAAALSNDQLLAEVKRRLRTDLEPAPTPEPQEAEAKPAPRTRKGLGQSTRQRIRP